MPITNLPTETNPAYPDKPVLIELRQAEKQRNGSFRPQAFLKLLPTLRTSGLLLALPGEDLKNLLFLLSFLTPNGDCIAAVPQLAQAMHVPPLKVRSRMQRLAAFQWQGEPLVIFLRRESGMDTYTVNARHIAYEHTEQPVPEPPAPAYQAAGREVVIAHSREHYTQPRAAVERLIAEENGWPPPDELDAATTDPAGGREAALPQEGASVPPDPGTGSQAASGADMGSVQRQRAYIQRQLLRLGVSAEIAEDLLARFDGVRIQRQIQWLRYRKAKNPAGFLIAAIEDDYEAPAALWHRSNSQERAGQPTTPTDTSPGDLPASPVP